MPPLTLAAGVGVCEAVRALGAYAGLKWPNDVVVERGDGVAKLAGILVEAATRGEHVESTVVGVGLNVEVVPEAPGLTATSLAAEGGRAISVDDALAAVVPALERAVSVFVAEGAAAVVRAWKERSPFLGRPIRVREGQRELAGTFHDVDDEGALWLEAADGRRLRILSGEVLT